MSRKLIQLDLEKPCGNKLFQKDERKMLVSHYFGVPPYDTWPYTRIWCRLGIAGILVQSDEVTWLKVTSNWVMSLGAADDINYVKWRY